MPRRLYLYEVVDIVGQGQYEYMEHLWKDPVLRMPDMFGLQGSFYVCAAGGGRWPQVINIWDVGSRGWLGWAANVDRMNLKRRKAFYGDWWGDAARGLDDDGEADERLVDWERAAAEFVTGGDTHVMTPLPRTVYGPPDWEDASLEDWLQ